MKVTPNKLKKIIREELQATLEEQQQYTSAEKALFKKITGSGLGKTLVQKLLSVFKNSDVEYITPKQRDFLFKDFADYSSGRNKPTGGLTLSPEETKKFDFERLVQGSRDVPDGFEEETFNILQRFLKSGKLYIPNKNMPAGGTSRERFFEALKDAQSDQPEVYGTGEGQLAAKARKAMEVLQLTQNLVISLSQSENNLSVEDYAKLKAPAVEAIETVYGLTGLIGMAIAPSDEDEFLRAQEKMRAELKAQAEEQWEAEQAIKQRDIRRAVKRAMTPMTRQQRAAARVAMFGTPGDPGQQVTTNEGGSKTKITKGQLQQIIKEEVEKTLQENDPYLDYMMGGGNTGATYSKLRDMKDWEAEVMKIVFGFFDDPGLLSVKERDIKLLRSPYSRARATIPFSDGQTSPAFIGSKMTTLDELVKDKLDLLDDKLLKHIKEKYGPHRVSEPNKKELEDALKAYFTQKTRQFGSSYETVSEEPLKKVVEIIMTALEPLKGNILNK
tara:strand:+ start:1062 stop:2561 length:1500 start_codon:yes stop_codon:yes gene_type:complete